MKNLFSMMILCLVLAGCDFFDKKAKEAASHFDFGFGQAQKAIDQNQEKIQRAQQIQKGLQKNQKKSYNSNILSY